MRKILHIVFGILTVVFVFMLLYIQFVTAPQMTAAEIIIKYWYYVIGMLSSFIFCMILSFNQYERGN